MANDPACGPGGCSRRGFLRACAWAAAALGLPPSVVPRVAEAAAAPDRPPVVWLHFQECTGCSEALLRASHPDVASLLLEVVSLDYHETLMAAAGQQAEEALRHTLEADRGRYLLVVEGAIPTRDAGRFCRVGGKTALESLREAAEGAAAVVAVGTCASFGGIPALPPNPTGAAGVAEVLPDAAVVNLPGCPPSPYNLLSVILYYLTFGRLPDRDDRGRPRFAYDRLIHEHCERRPHFDAGRFARAFGDEGHRKGWCLYQLGCKGPITHANCSVQGFNDLGLWPVGVGHPCVGCAEPGGFGHGIGDRVPIHAATPPDTYPPVPSGDRGTGPEPAAVGVLGALAGAALGAGAVAARKLPDGEDGDARG
ncbi:hydrogenase small subunit [Deferrisoma palaeochoriense]